MLTAVFWDFENCRPHANASGHAIVDGIRRIVHESFPDASICVFKAYADLSPDIATPRALSLHSELQSSGLSLVHCPHNGKKDVADKMMLVDMMLFALDYPPPGAVVIISGDRDFAYAASALKNRRYRLIVSGPKATTHTSLRYQAERFFDWQKDVLHCEEIPNIGTKRFTGSGTPSTWKKSLSRPSLKSTSGTSILKPDEATDHLSHPLEGVHSHAAACPRDTASRSWDLLPLQSPEPEKTRLCPEEVSNPPYQCLASVACTSDSIPSTSKDGVKNVMEPIKLAENGGWYSTTVTLAQTGGDSQPPWGPRFSSSVPTVTEPVLINTLQCGVISLVADEGSTGGSDSDNGEDAESDEHSSAMQFSAYESETPLLQNEIQLSRVNNDGIGTLQPDFVFPAKEENENPDDDIDIEPLSALVLVSDADRRRFSTLIAVFQKNYEASKMKTMLSATAAAQMLKIEKHVYMLAGATRLKDYIEAARTANVIISPGLDKNGTAILELNPSLYASPFVPDYTTSLTTLQDACTGTDSSGSADAYNPELQEHQDQMEWSFVSDASRRRFSKLVVVFNKDFGPDNRTKVLVSEVEAALCRRNPMSFEGFYDPKIKKLLNTAQTAGVIAISEGRMWVELNPALYWTSSTAPADGSAAPTLSSESPPQASSDDPLFDLPHVDPIFYPLIGLLRDSWPSSVLRSRIGLQLSNEVYKRASVTRLGEYLSKAVAHGVIDVGTKGPGKEWVRLKPEYKYVP